MLEFERVDVPLSIHGAEVRYVVKSKTGVLTGCVAANKNGVSLSGRFPKLQSDKDVRVFQFTLRKAAKISTMLKCGRRGINNNLPSEDELEHILVEEEHFTLELPRQAIAETDWRPIDEEDPLDDISDLPDLDTDIV